jgi:steroid 5-alpha reductase family enzyme
VITTLLTTLGVVVTIAVGLWLLSLRLRDASIVDIFWGLGFAVVAWTAHLTSGSETPRAWLACVMVTIWGVRLATHLARRNLGHGEDYRYRAMRAKHGDRFPLVSLATVFLLQAGLLWIIALPVQLVHAPGAVAPLGVIDVAGVLAWAIGLTLEWAADVQLMRFKRLQSNKGAVMDRGLWRYSRHPNYFGNFLLWWGIGLVGVGAGAWWSLIGPALLTFLLVRVSGVALLESTIAERRPGYRDYVARTSAFVPWFPRRSRVTPRA